MEYATLLEHLKELAENDYKAFNNKIIPTEQTILGVRVPALRKLARQITKTDALAFIQLDKHNIYEMIMLEGMTLSYMDRSFIELLPLTETFLRKVDNWAQIDSTICDYRNIRKEKEQVLTVVKRWLQADEEFVVRAGLVILLAHYIAAENLEMIFQLAEAVKHDGYYVYMANAWMISVCMAKHPAETILFFQNNALDDRTHNKAIQKARESFRVSREHKAIIKALKR